MKMQQDLSAGDDLQPVLVALVLAVAAMTSGSDIQHYSA